MTKGRRRLLCVLLIVLLLLSVFSGCSQNPGGEDSATRKPNVIGEEGVVYYDEPVTIRVLVDDYLPQSVFEDQLWNIADTFEDENVNVTVELEQLPNDADNLAKKLALLRMEIEQGEGPDVYLLSTSWNTDMLFPDVNQAMRDGVFLNLTNYYGADAELGIDSLNTFVMEAGMVDGVQYTLPLRYDFPVMYVIPEQLEKMNLPTESLTSDVFEMLDTVTWLENRRLAAVTQFYLFDDGLNFFPELVNYDTGEVLVKEEDVLELLELYAQFDGVLGEYEEYEPYQFGGGFQDFLTGSHWAEQGCGVWAGSVADALQSAAMCQALDCELEMYPLTGKDGKVVAEVSYYGAIDSNTEHPELAYDFLRRFLTEEFQWEQNVRETSQNWNMDLSGYCVRTADSVGPYYQSIQSRIARTETDVIFAETKRDGTVYRLSEDAFLERIAKLSAIELTDADVPILQTYIDVARYPASDMENELQNSFADEIKANPKKQDWQSVAENFIESLEAHLNRQ